jgi:hypothetical protein
MSRPKYAASKTEGHLGKRLGNSVRSLLGTYYFQQTKDISYIRAPPYDLLYQHNSLRQRNVKEQLGPNCIRGCLRLGRNKQTLRVRDER